MNRGELVDGLELDNQPLLHQEVWPNIADQPILVNDGNRGLSNEPNAAQRQFQVERSLVNAPRS